jgi:hypothetical protein
MSISFKCEHCHKQVEAPDAAAGKRGKCPYCQESVYIPAPVKDDELLDLAPIDEEEERRLERERRLLHEQQKALLLETDRKVVEPPDEKEGASAADVEHLVVNYCLDMVNGKLTTADAHAKKLRGFGAAAQEAVANFISGKSIEPALAKIPGRLLQGFLTELRDKLR